MHLADRLPPTAQWTRPTPSCLHRVLVTRLCHCHVTMYFSTSRSKHPGISWSLQYLDSSFIWRKYEVTNHWPLPATRFSWESAPRSLGTIPITRRQSYGRTVLGHLLCGREFASAASVIGFALLLERCLSRIEMKFYRIFHTRLSAAGMAEPFILMYLSQPKLWRDMAHHGLKLCRLVN